MPPAARPKLSAGVARPASGWRTCWEKRGEWDLETDAANQALFDPALLSVTYADALRRARELSRAQAS